jgi:hypothetical protein
MKCRHCGSVLSLPLVDLGSAPPSNAYLSEHTLHALPKLSEFDESNYQCGFTLLFKVDTSASVRRESNFWAKRKAKVNCCRSKQS